MFVCEGGCGQPSGPVRGLHFVELRVPDPRHASSAPTSATAGPAPPSTLPVARSSTSPHQRASLLSRLGIANILALRLSNITKI
ncbi:uncharacterized protein PpBr36_06178 [Pyricularia pennisetigena]|uniref:uncharacterized protein n=1 Tax=Pyricularia pennisetigena TaxID=1578925 RepID=UPI00114F4FCC|nr:uncharacterized protein PpBr36_06178 [Pyricularia pennisetigena]TLS22703.1 hypothetical protein PpBr36_06178 [Pyricularia pennisetigena]